MERRGTHSWRLGLGLLLWLECIQSSGACLHKAVRFRLDGFFGSSRYRFGSAAQRCGASSTSHHHQAPRPPPQISNRDPACPPSNGKHASTTRFQFQPANNSASRSLQRKAVAGAGCVFFSSLARVPKEKQVRIYHPARWSRTLANAEESLSLPASTILAMMIRARNMLCAI